MKIRNACIFLFLLLLITKIQVVLGQDELAFPDSTSFVDFLISQGEIPGLQFRLVDSSGYYLLDNAALDTLSDSNAVDEFARALALKDSLFGLDSTSLEIQFLIYNEVNSLEGTQEFVSNLLRNGDLTIRVNGDSGGKDLISLANRERYSPLPSTMFAFVGDFKIFIVILTISLFILFAISMILFMLIFKARRNRREKLLVTYDAQIVGPLSEILFEKTLEGLESISDEELYESFPLNQLKKPLYVKILVERILALNKKMKGDFKLKLKALYKRLKLDKVTLQKLESSRWDTVVTGLVEVNEMDLTEAIRAVKQHVNSPNFHIRSQAVATVLNISDSVDLNFLRDQTFPLSRWQQMNYLRIIKFLHSSRNLNITSLFDSKNQSIRLFGYKLVRVLGRVDLLTELEQKYASANVEGKIEIIKTFEYLGVPAHTELVNNGLKSNEKALVAMAAKAAGTIGDEVTVNIICELLEKEPEFRLKMTLLKSLKSLNEEVYKQIINGDPNPDLHRINKHLLDPLLQDV